MDTKRFDLCSQVAMIPTQRKFALEYYYSLCCTAVNPSIVAEDIARLPLGVAKEIMFGPLIFSHRKFSFS